MQSAVVLLALLGAWTPQELQDEGAAPKLHGRLLDARGSPLPGVDLAWNRDRRTSLVRTGSEGTFELEARRLPSMEYLVVAEGQDVTTVVGAVTGLCGPTGEYLMVAAPKTSVTGRVVDPDGEPIAGAALSVELDTRRLLLAFPRALDADTFVGARGLSESSGEFSIAVPAVEGLTLTARSAGRAPIRIAISGVSSEAPAPIVLTLRETAPPWLWKGLLHGEVLMQDGSPASCARVVLGNVEARTDERGSFTTAMHKGFRYDDVLCAALPGYLPSLVSDPANKLAASGTAENPVVLTLGGPALSISGRVTDALGNPCVEWNVELVDADRIRPTIYPTLLAEHLAGGREADQPAMTGSDGTFRIDGLQDRTYVLDAWPEWGWSGYGEVTLRSAPIRAGTSDVELRLGPDAWIERVLGRVVDLEGRPLAGLTVHVELDQPMVWIPANSSASIQRKETDAEGRFILTNVPRQSAFFVLRGVKLPFWPVDQQEEWTLTLPLEPNLRFDWRRAAPPPISIEALDEAGAPLPIFNFSAGRALACHHLLELEGVRSYLLAVSASATVLRMRLDGERMESVLCRIEPGAVKQITVD